MDPRASAPGRLRRPVRRHRRHLATRRAPGAPRGPAAKLPGRLSRAGEDTSPLARPGPRHSLGRAGGVRGHVGPARAGDAPAGRGRRPRQAPAAAVESMTQAAGLIADMREAPSGAAALDRVASSARSLLGVRMASIVVADHASNTIRIVALDGFDKRDRPLEYRPDEAPTVCKCMQARDVIDVEDVDLTPGVNRVGLQAWGVRSALFTPLVVQDRAIGCMVLADRVPRKYTASEIRLARAMGAQVAVILANQRLIHEKDDALAMQRRLAGQREALYQISTE